MNLHRFNADGISMFSNYRSKLTLDASLPPPREILTDPALTEEVSGGIEVLTRSFATRLEAGVYLNELIDLRTRKPPALV